eukprot:Skav225320  [mRNA]  locus=scaffold891:150669:151550:- [translate_table: standard]
MRFQPADLEDERQLMADLWSRPREMEDAGRRWETLGDAGTLGRPWDAPRTCLRRGELSKALKLCAESGQADSLGYDITETGPDEETEARVSRKLRVMVAVLTWLLGCSGSTQTHLA